MKKAVVCLNTDRRVAIDCANVACHFLQCVNNLGDALGPIEAYKYWKNKGYNTKIFVLKRKLRNPKYPKLVMENIDKFESEIPSSDRVIIPVSDDDDSYLIEWALRKNAIVVTNDLFRDHKSRIDAKRKGEFDHWVKAHRCGFIFVDGEYIPNPQFEHIMQNTPNTNVLEEKTDPNESDIEIETKKKKFPKPKGHSPKGKEWDYDTGSWVNLQSYKLDDKEIESLRGIHLSDKLELMEKLDVDLEYNKGNRNELNKQVSEFIVLRDNLNAEVRIKIIQVKKLKESRDKLNKSVKSLKNQRDILSKDLKKARFIQKSTEGTSKGKESITKLQKEQDKSHKNVIDAVEKAQELHEKMIEISNEVDRIRDKASQAHNSITEVKNQADEFHKKYLQILYKKFALADLIEYERGPVKNDFSQLLKSQFDYSHKTINVTDGPIFNELNNTLKDALSEFNSTSGRRKHMADRVDVRYIVRENNRLEISSSKGFFLKFLRENRAKIKDSFVEKYNLEILKISIRTSKK
tara:strand:- start:381 stop:1940 length:1560 start_codon:yes stop_codon:yes gene_type:complete